jgi:tetratricopeptide (TPR) repeat protein
MIASAYDRLGNASADKGDFDSAIADYTKAIALNPKLAAAYDRRGFAYYKLARYEAALADYDAALGSKPNQAIDAGKEP